mmetsp:Transcript_38429/g.91809  ORF Transcript_38429/g.91809 Transcript_38429/m.91809 type:complete len:387 (-) Transcript_38429:13-1173(-)
MHSGYPSDASYSYGTSQGFQGDAKSGKSPFGRAQRRSINLPALALCLVLPWLIFTIVYSLCSLSLHYTSPGLVSAGIGLAAVVVLLLAYSALQNLRSGEDGQSTWYFFLFVCSAANLALAVVLGNMNYRSNLVPFMDVNNMNEYDMINPAESKGNQLMDAGRVHFVPDAKLDIAHSMGFRNLDTYCVAPIASGKQDNYDFWAVGLNCCSGHVADFHCGEFNNPGAHSGLRLMRDDLRSYYRLAVDQATAAYNINANHPIFFYWMQDPATEISAYESAAYTNWMVGIFVALGVQLLLVAAILGWAVITVTPFFMVLGALLGGGLRNWHRGLRVATEVEMGGLDQALHGVTPKRGLAMGGFHARQISEAGIGDDLPSETSDVQVTVQV